MESKFFYKGMSKIYDLLDVLYFNNIDSSPRKAVYDYLDPQDVKILDICTGKQQMQLALLNLRKIRKL